MGDCKWCFEGARRDFRDDMEFGDGDENVIDKQNLLRGIPAERQIAIQKLLMKERQFL